MYQGFTDEEDYFDPLGHNVSDGEDSAGSELDDLETRLYSQIHYGEQFNKGKCCKPITVVCQNMALVIQILQDQELLN